MTTHDLIRRARELAKLREKATNGQWVGGPWCQYLPPADRKLVIAAPDMAELLEKMADEMDRCYRALKILAKEIDEINNCDVHTRAFGIMLQQNQGWDGETDVPDDVLVEAFIRCCLEE